MISNRDRDSVIEQLSHLAIHQSLDFESLVASIKTREHQLLRKDPLLLEDLYLLANFCRLFPDRKETKTVLAAISIACDANTLSRLKRFAVRSVYHYCLTATSHSQLDKVSPEEAEWLGDYLKDVDIQDDVSTLCDHADSTLRKLRDRTLFGPKNLIRNLTFLKKQISSVRNPTQGLPPDQLQALQALQYLYDSDDLIPDEHGYIGLLDDNEVINHAIYQMAPSLEEIDRLEASLKGQFKNLCQLQFSQAGEKYSPFKTRGEVSSYTPSGYLLATASPLLNKVASPEEKHSHIIITDESVVHCLLASLITAIASFEIDCDHHVPQGSKEVSLLPEPGTSISLEDGTKYQFDGVQAFGDQNMVVLETIGKRSQSKRYIPVEQFKNWAKSNADGKFRRDSRGKYILNFAEICHDFDRFDYSELKTSQNIFLVCKKQLLEDQLDEVTINGHSWRKVVPTARITRNLTLDSDVGAHELTGNKLFLVPSLGTLTSFLFEEKELKNHGRAIVIVEGSEAANQVDELLTLHQIGLSIFLFCNENASAADLNQLTQEGFSAFKWDQTLTELLPPTGFPPTPTPLITSWEYRLSASRFVKLKGIPVESAHAETIFESLRELDELERHPASELSERGVDAIKNLKRLAVQIMRASCNEEERSGFLSRHLSSISEQKELAGADRRLQPLVREILESFCNTLSTNVPLACKDKWRAYDEHKSSMPGFSNFESLIDRTRRKHDLNNSNMQVVSCFWPGKSRMNRILSRTNKLAIDFVLFESEIKWLESYERSHSFHPDQDTVPPFLQSLSSFQAVDGGLESLEDIEQTENMKDRRSKVLMSSQEASVSDMALATRSILLEPDAILFCSERSHLTLLRTNERGSQVLEARGADILVGDLLLFSEGSDKNVISEIADTEFLLPGEREIATQWRKDLIAHKEKQSLEFSELQEEMKSAGIERHVATIRHWCDLDAPMIAPTNHEVVIPLMWELFSPARADTDLARTFECIERVRSAHIKAAKQLEERLIQDLSKELNELESVSFLTGIQQFEVVMITKEHTELPYRLLSKPQY